MPAAKMRICKDHELPTPTAIQFRIDHIKAEANNVLNPQQAARIAALRRRLPTDPNAPLAPAIDPNLLISKKDVDWDGRKPQLYA